MQLGLCDGSGVAPPWRSGALGAWGSEADSSLPSVLEVRCCGPPARAPDVQLCKGCVPVALADSVGVLRQA
jgi:hypothetical protein